MAAGPFYLFDRTLLKCFDGTLDLDTVTVKGILLASSQAVTRAFLGTSGDARYADLTGELATANGYTAGGATLAQTLTRSATNVVTFNATPWSWMPSGAGLTAKYAAIYVASTTNKELLCVADLDPTGGGSIFAIAGTLLVLTPDPSGIFTATQP